MISGCNRQARCAPGVTILELLVIISTITVLAALLLPAVLAAREASHNSECTNHLRQIGVALHAYEETHRVLPAGWQPEASGESAYGWASAILPQVEEGALGGRIDRSRPIAQVSLAVRTTTPALYLCPSDYGDRDFPLFTEIGGHDAQQSTQMLVSLPRANYVGVFGTKDPDEFPGKCGGRVYLITIQADFAC